MVVILAERYEIIIRNETKQRKTPIATEPNIDGESSVAAPITKSTASKGSGSRNALASAIVATNVIKPYIQQAISFGISQIDMQTGSAELQRKAQFWNNVGSSATSIIVAGAAGGPVGALGAAAMLGVTTAIETGINYVNINNRKILEAENLQLARSRAGMVTNHSREGGTV